MLLVYAMTRATTDGWGAATTLGAPRRRRRPDRARSSLIELRSPAPLLPLRIFRLRTLTGANAAMAIVGAVAFSEFFLLTLYLQDVLHYSAVESGVAFIGFALTVVVISNVAQVVVGRFGVRADADRRAARLRRSPSPGSRGCRSTGTTSGISSRRSSSAAPGMGLSFVPVTIASLTGVERSDAGVASGLDQHEPPDRRRDRHRRGERDRRHLDEQLRATPMPA